MNCILLLLCLIVCMAVGIKSQGGRPNGPSMPPIPRERCRHNGQLRLQPRDIILLPNLETCQGNHWRPLNVAPLCERSERDTICTKLMVCEGNCREECNKSTTVTVTQRISQTVTVTDKCTQTLRPTPTLTQCSSQPTTSCQPCPTHKAELTSTFVQPCQPTPGSAVGKESSGGSSSTLALGVITGILVVALVMMVIVGMVGTCCFVLKKNKGKPTEKDSQESKLHNLPVPNPAYHNNISKPLPRTAYSSMGPDYEVGDDRRTPPQQVVHHTDATNSSEPATESDHYYQMLEDHTYEVLESVGDKRQRIRVAPVENKETEAAAAVYEVPVPLRKQDEK